jgi:large subunit ribosomal protein L15
MITLSNLGNPYTNRQKRKRVGRGPSSGNGKTAGRGHKGAKARSGYSLRAGFEGGQMPLHRRVPKRGFRHQKRHPMAELNVDVLEDRFEAGAEVTPEILANLGILRPLPGGVKVLGRGEITKALKITANAISPGAQAKIEAVGGTVTIVSALQPADGAADAAK